jgi:hypothetical protein
VTTPLPTVAAPAKLASAVEEHQDKPLELPILDIERSPY